jgi:hypothetical protein
MTVRVNGKHRDQQGGKLTVFRLKSPPRVCLCVTRAHHGPPASQSNSNERVLARPVLLDIRPDRDGAREVRARGFFLRFRPARVRALFVVVVVVLLNSLIGLTTVHTPLLLWCPWRWLGDDAMKTSHEERRAGRRFQGW